MSKAIRCLGFTCVLAALTACSSSPKKPENLTHAKEENQTDNFIGQSELYGEALTGHPIAQYKYALKLLRAGQEAESASFMKLAADQNHSAAAYFMGIFYSDGTGVPKDINLEIEYLTKSANQDHPFAMYNLGVIYSQSGGFTPNSPIERTKIAMQWFEKAAEFGIVDAQFNLAELIRMDQSNAERYEEAYFWYRVAEINNDTQSTERAVHLKVYYLSPEDIERLDKKAANFIPKKYDSKIVKGF